MNVSKLWGKRCKSFWKEVTPYIRYVINGGLGVFIILLFTVGGYFYSTFLNQVTPDFPAATVGMLLLSLLIGWNSIRTFLRDPDIVFLAPVQSQMKAYIKRATIYSVIVHMIPFTLVLAIYWPVFQRATGADGSVFFFIWLSLTLIKLVNLRGGWIEQHIREDRTKRIFSTIRWILSILLIWLTFSQPVWRAALLIVFSLLAYLVSLGLPDKLPFHWERLIAWEQRHRSRIYMFLSGFTDVDELPQQVRKRSWLAGASRWIPFRRESAYTYLYFKTWLRSDLFATCLRLLLIGLVVILFSSIGWVKATALGVILLLVGMQLSTLTRMHQHAIWVHVYPLPAASRKASAASLSAAIHSCVFIVLLLALILTTLEVNIVLMSGAIGFVLVWLFYLRNKRVRKTG